MNIAHWAFRVVAKLLLKAKRDFVFVENRFVIDFLEHAATLGKECFEATGDNLFNSPIAGVKSGAPWQPFPDDFELRSRAIETLRELAGDRLPGSFVTGCGNMQSK